MMTSSTFCMEPEGQEEGLKQLLAFRADRNYKKLRKFLKKHDVNSIHPNLQYQMLKTCILFNNTNCLELCLDHTFNPNRYHKNLSLLHYAIQEKNYIALCTLTNANVDLVPCHDLGATFAENPILETPLDFAARLLDTPGNSYDTTMRYQECVRVMTQAIRTKYNDIIFNKKHCGLTKHLIGAERPCLRCIDELGKELQWHRVTYIPYSATSNYSNTATEADSSSNL